MWLPIFFLSVGMLLQPNWIILTIVAKLCFTFLSKYECLQSKAFELKEIETLPINKNKEEYILSLEVVWVYSNPGVAVFKLFAKSIPTLDINKLLSTSSIWILLYNREPTHVRKIMFWYLTSSSGYN